MIKPASAHLQHFLVNSDVPNHNFSLYLQRRRMYNMVVTSEQDNRHL
jgi:hypothetical protein